MSFLFITPDEIVLGLSVGLLLGLPLAGLVGCGRVVVGQTTTDTVLGAVVSVSVVGVAGITAASMELIQLTTTSFHGYRSAPASSSPSRCTPTATALG